ncbi:MAG: hypothetical protein ABF723_05200 [Lentilactobacillus hilgardii]|uniref:hypothetical protein n=1 Tax=Lentilactobacillus hilgardii TaxID=1588 RepID=UPI0039EC2E02
MKINISQKADGLEYVTSLEVSPEEIKQLFGNDSQIEKKIKYSSAGAIDDFGKRPFSRRKSDKHENTKK